MRFTISILAHQNLALTKRCLASVFPTLDNDEVILTDNASTDGTADFFDECRRFREVRVFHNVTNLGFQEPNRRALDCALGEFTVLLNNDTVVPPDWLCRLAECFKDPNVLIAGPDCNKRALRGDFIGVPAKSGYVWDYLEGSCLAFRTIEVRRMGLFDPNLRFCCGEDSDLCLRARAVGHTLGLAFFPLQHDHGATCRLVPGVADIIRENNAYLCAKWKDYLVTRKFN